MKKTIGINDGQTSLARKPHFRSFEIRLLVTDSNQRTRFTAIAACVLLIVEIFYTIFGQSEIININYNMNCIYTKSAYVGLGAIVLCSCPRQ